MNNPEISRFHLISDAMFGRLGIFLRLLGVDTEIAGKNFAIDDDEIFLKLAQGNQVLLTRDEGLYQRVMKASWGANRAVFIPSRKLEEQLFLTLSALKFPINSFELHKPEEIQSRCSKCNGILKIVNKSEIMDRISEGTAKNINMFWQCSNPGCNQVYWIGKHWGDIAKIFETVFERMKKIL